MSVLPVGFGSATNGGGGFQIERSLRFNSADSAYLNRTPASASNRKTWTWSGWVKRTTVNTTGQNLFSTDNGSSTTLGQLFFNDNVFEFNCYASSAYQWRLITTQVWRDLSAWYHIVAVVDTTQATSSNRVKLYVNGVQITAFSTATYPSQNFDGAYNLNQPHYVGAAITSSGYLNGYLTEVNFIDGQALTPSSFGETDSATGVWKPKAYSGTYGTNGFFLKFADNSGTTSTTLGKDTSGNGNNWTPNNFSVTAGAGNDSLVDSPTSYGTDTGIGGSVRGNYATYNSAGSAPSVTLSNGNLDASHGAFSSTTGAASTFGVSSGKWYWEVTINTISSGAPFIGIVRSDQLYPFTTLFANNSQGYAYRSNGQKRNNSTDTAYGASYTNGDVIGVALDMDAGTIVFYKNNSSQGTAFSSLSGTFIPIDGNGTSGGTYTSTANFGQRAFAYTAPSGFKALCTQNLPTPTIGATSTTQANDYFDVKTWSGNSSTQSIALEFAPGLIWNKTRSGASGHAWWDVLRGTGAQISSSETDAESTGYNAITSFSSNAISLGADNTGTYNGRTNETGRTYVGWVWNAGGSNATNTSGSITSTVRANTTSGFSIVTYTGTGANATVGHGLGVAPGMVILKGRSGSGSGNSWRVYHSGANASPASGALYLNSTSAFTTDATAWNSTAPTSTVFSLGTDAGVNSTGTYVAYCFAPVAGYSAFGSYTGNGSTDGPFVYLGFRPAYVLIKRSSAIESWCLMDSKREGYNVDNDPLYPNLSNAEGTQDFLDLLSNGFKLRSTDTGVNGSGTYIYAAFAEHPFKYSLAR